MLPFQLGNDISLNISIKPSDTCIPVTYSGTVSEILAAGRCGVDFEGQPGLYFSTFNAQPKS